MKIKKQYLQNIIHKGGQKILLTEIMDEQTMKMLKNEFPEYLEEDKPKKSTKKKDVESDELK